MDYREGGPEEPVSESEDESEDETGGRGAIDGEEGSMGMGREGSIAGRIWKPLPKLAVFVGVPLPVNGGL